ncbi:MAG: SIS domain-containing protein [Atopobiaceae bacterium]|jgi:tagatose-6-phosphate ketose/aldose isomerase|nr:SIS domain-containing protein [Atopobiaceae bacterium]MCI2174204.1 SIS domain-containing protein [Atopobiaceae bacterium]MCI2206845.1 SIS domain-containing protein [Atopobiaceae bacterium]
MFEKDEAELKAMGADITTREIKQQPGLWAETYRIYQEMRSAIDGFVAEAAAMGKGRTRVVFAGAGTSAYVGDTVAPYLRRVGDTDTFDFAPVATTDIVSAPLDFLRADDPTIFVSFARSGNSPESLAAVERARTITKDIKFLNITCAPEGKLAVQAADDPDALTILLPGANDQGFAMTGSFSCMALMAMLIFDPATDEQKKAWVDQAKTMGEEVVSREGEVASFLAGDYDRLTYLGSGALGGLTREAQLKVLELAAGKMATSFDTSMGYRHGPKSFVDDRTLVFVFVSNDPYTRQYDVDILNEIGGDDIAQHTIAIQQDTGELYDGETFLFRGYDALPEGYLALPYVMVAQTVSLLNSIKVGNTPDTPSPSGTVNRVVKGVTLHPFSL